jgi:hypothetical protein
MIDLCTNVLAGVGVFFSLIRISACGLSSFRHHASTHTDYGVCSSPWHLFVLGKHDRYTFVYSNLYTPIKNILS